VVAEGAGDPEHEVVPRLVLEQKRTCGFEKRARIADSLDDHAAIVYFIGNA
jgi:hypothetical protein